MIETVVIILVGLFALGVAVTLLVIVGYFIFVGFAVVVGVPGAIIGWMIDSVRGAKR